MENKKERIFKNTYSSQRQEQENSFDKGNWMNTFMIARRYQNWLKIS